MQRDQAHKTNELLERIAIALEKNNVKKEASNITKDVLDTVKTITDDYASRNHPNEGYDDDVHNDYLNDLVQGMSMPEFLQFHNEMNHKARNLLHEQTNLDPQSVFSCENAL